MKSIFLEPQITKLKTAHLPLKKCLWNFHYKMGIMTECTGEVNTILKGLWDYSSWLHQIQVSKRGLKPFYGIYGWPLPEHPSGYSTKDSRGTSGVQKADYQPTQKKLKSWPSQDAMLHNGQTARRSNT